MCTCSLPKTTIAQWRRRSTRAPLARKHIVYDAISPGQFCAPHLNGNGSRIEEKPRICGSVVTIHPPSSYLMLAALQPSRKTRKVSKFVSYLNNSGLLLAAAVTALSGDVPQVRLLCSFSTHFTGSVMLHLCPFEVQYSQGRKSAKPLLSYKRFCTLPGQ